MFIDRIHTSIHIPSGPTFSPALRYTDPVRAMVAQAFRVKACRGAMSFRREGLELCAEPRYREMNRERIPAK